MPRRELLGWAPFLALATVGGCGRIDFDARTDGGGAAVDVLPGTYTEQVMASAPRAYYRLDEAAGSTALDATGHGFNGTYMTLGGMTGYRQPGALSATTSTGVRIDGEGNAGMMSGDARMQFPNTVLDWSSDFTIEMFALVHMKAQAGFPNLLLLCEVYMTNGFRFAVSPADQLTAWTNESGGAGGIDAFTMVSYGVYMHLALVQKASMFTIYIDGQMLIAGPLTYVPVGSAAECAIGSLHGNPTGTTFDELALYDRALTANEVASHAASR